MEEASPTETTGQWELWIDVGGTFTDCIARDPQGHLTTHKLLSSGNYLGEVGEGSTRDIIVDPERRRDPNGFFAGYRLRLWGPDTGSASAGHPGPRAEATVAEFDAATGSLRLDSPLPMEVPLGTRYELTANEPAPIAGLRRLMGKRLRDPVGPVRVRLGTTRATNALLERKGAPAAFVTTAGFGDCLKIAYQNRPDLFALRIRKPEALSTEIVELDERLDSQGNILHPLDRETTREQLRALKAKGIQAIALCLLHAYANPAHEAMVEAIAHELGFEQVSRSSALNPLPKLVSRGDTTVVDAYLSPVLRAYLDDLRARIPEADIRLMTSAGALVRADGFSGKDTILSGPAGGVVGAAHIADQADVRPIIAFDMGGTSTDVSLYNGEYERRYEMELRDPDTGGSTRIVAPMLAVETVAAGGGSICRFDGVKPVVGPSSAGAAPGPACYGQGGPLCLTDVNLFLGRLPPEQFPFPLDTASVRDRLDDLRETIAHATGTRYSREGLAIGFLNIANANMAAPIKRISVARGYDPRAYTLLTFGGAGGQHGCALARDLGMRRILCTPFAGVLSALGIGLADVTKFAQRPVRRRYDEVFAERSAKFSSQRPEGLREVFGEMEDEARRQLTEEGIAPDRMAPPRRLLDMRYAGQESVLTILEPDDGDFRRVFEQEHEQLYGFRFPDRPIEIHAARLELTGHTPKPSVAAPPKRSAAKPIRFIDACFEGRYYETPVYHRDQLATADRIPGPAIVCEATGTIVIDPGWEARLLPQGEMLVEDRMAAPHTHATDTHATGSTENARATGPDKGGEDEAQTSTSIDLTQRDSVADEAGRSDPDPDPVDLELFNNHFASVADRMGAVLQKTAVSTNVKERLDFSCGIFTANGDLVVNAPHIPVHLGAMSECVRSLLEAFPEMHPGEVYITNDPYRGGSHLPDVTVVTPVFGPPSDDGVSPVLFFTASRAHHAEIGGVTPGSMPPFSKTLAEEGVLIPPTRLQVGAPESEAFLKGLFASGPYPSRAPDENVADLHAQMAANQMGARLLLGLVQRESWAKVRAYMGYIQDAAERKMRTALAGLPAGRYERTDYLDNGAAIRVRIDIRHPTDNSTGGAQASVDFAGTGPALTDNLNANRAITTSAVIYCFRCLIHEEIPLNAGMLAPIHLAIPTDSLLDPPSDPDPKSCPAVVGGNVETSQRIVDVIFGALGVAAGSQGTMNNLLFGRSKETASVGSPSAFGYYETLAGGSGAGPDFAGCDAVHTHMTNTRLTDPEVLEARYPVRVTMTAIRRDSGGHGHYPGGNGLIRELEFLEPLDVSLLTSRRTTQPYGLTGGHPGKAGRNFLRRLNETVMTEVAGTTLIRVQAGDRLRIETPGGGGYGKPGR